jgi:ABC-type sugar transport system permease subunit
MFHNRPVPFFLFIAPALLVYGLFCVFPTALGVMSSFFHWDGYSQARDFIGLANFRQLAGDGLFWTAFRNNIFLVLAPGSIMFFLALYLANSLHHERMPGRAAFQFTYLFPNILAGTVVAALWSFVYNPSFGAVKEGLSGAVKLMNAAGLGGLATMLSLPQLAATAWLAPDNLLKALVPMLVWSGVGFYTVLFLAGMQNIPKQLYEAARIDGANEWQIFWTITWPSLGPVRVAAMTFIIISGMKMFDTIWVMTQQMVPDRNQVLGTYVYQQAFVEAQMGYGTAIALVLMALITVFVVAGQWLGRKT